MCLFTGRNAQDIGQLGREGSGSMVLDSACSSTVCGINWFNDYISLLDDVDRKAIVKESGKRVFQFGGGTRLKSLGQYMLPSYVVGKRVLVKTDVVSSEIPMLLSKTAMKGMKVKMNYETDTADILGKHVNLNCTSSGHYCLPITKSAQEDESILLALSIVFAVKFADVTSEERQKMFLKLHRQMGHPVNDKLISLMKDAGVWDDSYKTEISFLEDCSRCIEYRRNKPRPVVALPAASYFNQRVAIDLKKWKNKWILHMVDMWSRYTMSVFVNRKVSSGIIDRIMEFWIGVFGVPRALMSDNGGEFCSDEMKHVCSFLNVEIFTTAAESPFQNGLCEKVHHITDSILTKMVADNPRADERVLLKWANMARNSMQMWSGFSSHQLVFGVNPNLPNVMNGNLAAMEDTSISRNFADHLNFLQQARKQFIATESDERIRRALRNKIRAAEEVYSYGDKVMYKRENNERWLGPAKVLFQDGKVIWIRHGDYIVKVSPTRLTRASMDTGNTVGVQSDKISKSLQLDSSHHDTSQKSTVPYEKASRFQVIDEATNGVTRTVEKMPVADSNDIPHPQVAENLDMQNPEVEDNLNISYPETDDDFLGFSNKDGVTATEKYKTDRRELRNKNIIPAEAPLRKSQRLLDQEVALPVYITQIPKNKQNTEACIKAKETELKKLAEFDVFNEVPYAGQELISTRWILWPKGDEIRARLVARGFEEGITENVDSPTVGKIAVRVFLSLSASQRWIIKTTDIKSAFLQGNPIDRDVFVTPPKEAVVADGHIWKLRRCLYGLNDAARKFYDSVVMELKSLGCVQSRCDPALFYFKKNSKLCGLLVSHIDDFLHAGNATFDTEVMEKLRCRFVAGKLVDSDFSYVGFHIKQDAHSITLDQSEYVKKLDRPSIEPQRMLEKDSELTPKEYTLFRSIVGSMNWLAHGTRPDILFDLIDLSMKFNKATVEDLCRAMKVLRKLNDLSSIVKYPSLNLDVRQWKIIAFTDAALHNLSDKVGSTAGRVVFLRDKNDVCCTLSWKSNKIKRVVRSTLAAEALSLQEGIEESLYLQSLIEELINIRVPISAYTDNQDTIDSINSTKLVADKRLIIDIAAIKEELTEKLIDSIVWVPDKQQLANCLTKKGASNLSLLAVLHNGKLPILPAY